MGLHGGSQLDNTTFPMRRAASKRVGTFQPIKKSWKFPASAKGRIVSLG
jgi:hypothetical protein